MGRRDLIIDDGGQIQRDVIFGHADLARDLDDLDLNIDGSETLAQWVDLHEARVNCAFKAITLVSVFFQTAPGSMCMGYKPSEFRHQTDFALVDRFVGVGAADTTRDSTQKSDAFSQTMNYRNCYSGVRRNLIKEVDLLKPAYHPWAAELSSSCWIFCAYLGCKSSRRAGCTLTRPAFGSADRAGALPLATVLGSADILADESKGKWVVDIQRIYYGR